MCVLRDDLAASLLAPLYVRHFHRAEGVGWSGQVHAGGRTRMSRFEELTEERTCPAPLQSPVHHTTAAFSFRFLFERLCDCVQTSTCM